MERRAWNGNAGRQGEEKSTREKGSRMERRKIDEGQLRWGPLPLNDMQEKCECDTTTGERKHHSCNFSPEV